MTTEEMEKRIIELQEQHRKLLEIVKQLIDLHDRQHKDVSKLRLDFYGSVDQFLIQ